MLSSLAILLMTTFGFNFSPHKNVEAAGQGYWHTRGNQIMDANTSAGAHCRCELVWL